MSLRKRISEWLGDDPIMMIGVGLSVLWLLMVMMFWLLGPTAEPGSTSGLMRLAELAGIVLPLMMIWMAVGLARAVATLRAEANDLRLRLGHMREAAPQSRASAAVSQPVSQPASAPAKTPSARPAPTTAAAATGSSRAMQPASRPASDGRQTAMRFEADESIAVDPENLIRALNFPEGPDDRETIAALRAALRDHEYSRVIRAAQDVVTLLAENGLYMDHLAPDAPNPTLWRRFADGARGEQVLAMAAIRDDQADELTLAMLKGDEIFRDSAHHFLRHFDLMLTRIGGQLDDDQLARLADTRSARAFLLVGRTANVFG